MKTKWQYQIKQFKIVKGDQNNLVSSEEKFKANIADDVCIGYVIKLDKDNTIVVNLYLIPERHAKGKIYNYDDLLTDFIKFINRQNEKSIVFKNPSIDNWIDTKENWCRKTAHKLSVKYNLEYDDVLSLIFIAITKVFAKPHVYVGNLAYIARSAENEVLMYFRSIKNRLNMEHPLVVSLDELTNEDGERETSLHDIIGKEDDYHVEKDFEESKARIMKDMSYVFSAREIEQIIENRGQLPRNLYLRLLKWRKLHRREDYVD